MLGPVCTGLRDCIEVQFLLKKKMKIPGTGPLSRYVTSHSGQLSLAVPSWVGVMSTSQRAVMPCGCE